jgi:hypothetical protein
MNTQHTTGPWHIQDNTADIYGQLLVESAEHGAVAICYTMEKSETRAPAECLQNARLIASAPDMLQALHAVIALLSDPDADGTDANRVERQILEVIAKATGGAK